MPAFANTFPLAATFLKLSTVKKILSLFTNNNILNKMTQKETWDVVLKSIAIFGSFVAFIFSLVTWNEQNHIKRADFLENKITEFEDTSKLLARSILDNFAVCDTANAIAATMRAQEMIFIGSSRIKDSLDKNPDITFENIGKALNKLLPDTSISRQKVRLSFDKLLDFFGKLDYYTNLDLMTKKEVEYFTYYVKRCADNDGIMEYAKKNSFSGFLSLVDKQELSEKK
jgi:hypothetical protein